MVVCAVMPCSLLAYTNISEEQIASIFNAEVWSDRKWMGLYRIRRMVRPVRLVDQRYGI
jgi:hypothetical protein